MVIPLTVITILVVRVLNFTTIHYITELFLMSDFFNNLHLTHQSSFLEWLFENWTNESTTSLQGGEVT